MKKRIIGFVLTAAMVIGSLPFGAVNVYGDDILLLPENEITEDFGVSETGIGEISDVEPDAADADETDITKTTDTADTTDASDTNDKEDDDLTDALNRKDTGTEEEGMLFVQEEQTDPEAADQSEDVLF